MDDDPLSHYLLANPLKSQLEPFLRTRAVFWFCHNSNISTEERYIAAENRQQWPFFFSSITTVLSTIPSLSCCLRRSDHSLSDFVILLSVLFYQTTFFSSLYTVLFDVLVKRLHIKNDFRQRFHRQYSCCRRRSPPSSCPRLQLQLQRQRPIRQQHGLGYLLVDNLLRPR